MPTIQIRTSIIESYEHKRTHLLWRQQKKLGERNRFAEIHCGVYKKQVCLRFERALISSFTMFMHWVTCFSKWIMLIQSKTIWKLTYYDCTKTISFKSTTNYNNLNIYCIRIISELCSATSYRIIPAIKNAAAEKCMSNRLWNWSPCSSCSSRWLVGFEQNIANKINNCIGAIRKGRLFGYFMIVLLKSSKILVMTPIMKTPLRIRQPMFMDTTVFRRSTIGCTIVIEWWTKAKNLLKK